MNRFDIMDTLGDLPEQYFAKCLPDASAEQPEQAAGTPAQRGTVSVGGEPFPEKPESSIRVPRWITGAALAACMLFAVGVGTFLLRGSREETSALNPPVLQAETSGTETGFVTTTAVYSYEDASAGTAEHTETEPREPVLYDALPQFTNKSDWKQWEVLRTPDAMDYYSGTQMPAGVQAIARTDPAGQPAPAGNPGPTLQIGNPHDDWYAVTFDFYVPENGQMSFVPFDEKNTVFADEALGDERFWFVLRAGGRIVREATFGKNAGQLRDSSGAFLEVPDYKCGIWNSCTLKSADGETGVFINGQFIGMLDELGAERAGYLALDGTQGTMFANFTFEEKDGAIPTPDSAPPAQTNAQRGNARTNPPASSAVQTRTTANSTTAAEPVTTAAATENPAVQSYYEKQKAALEAVLEHITDQPYEDVLTETIPEQNITYEYGYHWSPQMDNTILPYYWDEHYGKIELLRRLDDHRMYCIQRVDTGGLFYTFYNDNVLNNAVWMTKALSYSDFDDVHIGDSIEKVMDLEPVTEKWAKRAGLRNSADPRTFGFTQELLLKDGLLVIRYQHQMESSKNFERSFKITDMTFRTDFKESTGETFQGIPVEYDYTVLPEDYPD